MDDPLYNLAFERIILGTIIFEYDPDAIEEQLGAISPDLFYLPAHQDICTAMKSLFAAGKPVDEEFIRAELLQSKRFDEAVMLEIMTVNPISNTRAYIDEIVKKAKGRRLLELTTKIKKMVLETQDDPEDIYAMIEDDLQQVDAESGGVEPVTMAQAIYDYDHMKEPPKIQTGIRRLDEMLCGGFEPAQLIHIGGEKNVGKTTLLKQILYNTSAGFDSLFFSFEMPRWKMAKYTKRMTGPADLTRYRIIDTAMMPGRDVNDVARMIRRQWRKHGIRFVLIDSKMKLQHRSYKGRNDADKKGEIDAILNAVVQETGIVLMEIVQLSKEDIANGTMSGYGGVLQDYEADMQLLFYHSKQASGAVEIKPTKWRQEVKTEPTRLWLDEKELKFNDAHVMSVDYTGHHGDDTGETCEMVVID